MEIVDHHLQREEPESVYENLLTPALSYVRRDLLGGELNNGDQDFLFFATGEILEDMRLSFPREPQFDSQCHSPVHSVVGLPIHDEGDQLILRMLQRLLEPRNYSLEIASAGLLTSEFVSYVRKKTPSVICLGCVAPSELSRTRFVCKRLRREYPETPLVVARLGFVENMTKDEEILKKAGATEICATLKETRNKLIQIVQKLSFQTPPPDLTFSQEIHHVSSERNISTEKQ